MANVPVSVQIARWSALAAAFAAFGSIFSTLWTDRPWFIPPPATSIVQPAAPPSTAAANTAALLDVPKSAKLSFNLYDSAADNPNLVNKRAVEVKAPPPHWYENWMRFMWRHPTEVIITLVSILVMTIFGAVEFYFRTKRVAK